MLQVDLLPRNDERVPLVQEAMALQADNNTLALAVQDLRATLGAQQKGIDNMNWQLEQKTKQVHINSSLSDHLRAKQSDPENQKYSRIRIVWGPLIIRNSGWMDSRYRWIYPKFSGRRVGAEAEGDVSRHGGRAAAGGAGVRVGEAGSAVVPRRRGQPRRVGHCARCGTDSDLRSFAK